MRVSRFLPCHLKIDAMACQYPGSIKHGVVSLGACRKEQRRRWALTGRARRESRVARHRSAGLLRSSPRPSCRPRWATQPLRGRRLRHQMTLSQSAHRVRRLRRFDTRTVGRLSPDDWHRGRTPERPPEVDRVPCLRRVTPRMRALGVFSTRSRGPPPKVSPWILQKTRPPETMPSI